MSNQLTFAVAMVVVRPAALAVLEWAEGKPFGLVHMVPMPVEAQCALSFLLMDLTFYWWHVAGNNQHGAKDCARPGSRAEKVPRESSPSYLLAPGTQSARICRRRTSHDGCRICLYRAS